MASFFTSARKWLSVASVLLSLAPTNVAATYDLEQVFQVYAPVRFPTSTSNGTCSELLTSYSFAYSYGTPYIDYYTPPACEFNHVTWNLTVTVAGVQYDRLGTVSLGDIEIFRTSTAEPTTDGILWTYIKDVSPYLSLFKEDQKLIFDLDNIVDSTYTGIYNTTLTATFYNIDDGSSQADTIIPISARLAADNASSVFTVPPDIATNAITIPNNTVKAIFTVAATGQIDEEFWWGNVPEQDVDAFPEAGDLLGLSPWREIELYIDDYLVGVAWPFPIIFTGGVIPGFWHPIVGIDAFDLKEEEIDITPWLPLICDGNDHNYTIVISGLNVTANGTEVLSGPPDYWLVTGKLFLWEGETDEPTTGTVPTVSQPFPTISVQSQFVGNDTSTSAVLTYEVAVERQFEVTSTIKTSNGTQDVFWKQDLSFYSWGYLTDQADTEINYLKTTGHDVSSSGYDRKIVYPLNCTEYYVESDVWLSLTGSIERGKDVTIFGPTVFPNGLESFTTTDKGNLGAWMTTSQSATAAYIETDTDAWSYGSMNQTLQLSSVPVADESEYTRRAGVEQLYYRNVGVVNDTFIFDTIIDAGETTTVQTPEHDSSRSSSGAFRVPRLSDRTRWK